MFKSIESYYLFYGHDVTRNSTTLKKD